MGHDRNEFNNDGICNGRVWEVEWRSADEKKDEKRRKKERREEEERREKERRRGREKEGKKKARKKGVSGWSDKGNKIIGGEYCTKNTHI